MGTWKIHGRGLDGTFIRASVTGTRTTGDAKTTIGNTLTNLALLSFAYCEHYSLSISEFFRYRNRARITIFASGDDSLIIGNKEVSSLNLDLIQECGVKCGYKVTDVMEEAEYCSLWFTWGSFRGERKIMPMKKLGRLFSRTILAPPGRAAPTMHAPFKAYHTLAAQKCEAFINCLHFIPSAVRYYEELRDKHKVKADGVKPNCDSEDSHFSYDETDWDLSPELIDGICRRYDLEVRDVEDWIKWFEKLDFSPDMDHIVPWAFAEKDCYWDDRIYPADNVSFF
jgi:hypothetical protein